MTSIKAARDKQTIAAIVAVLQTERNYLRQMMDARNIDYTVGMQRCDDLTVTIAHYMEDLLAP